MSLDKELDNILADHKGEIIERCVDLLASRLQDRCLPDAIEAVTARVNAVIDAKLATMTEEFTNMSFYTTDQYGTPRKDRQKRTFAEVVFERCTQWLNENVDEYGRVTSYGTNKPRIVQMAEKAATELVKGPLEAEIKKASAEFRANVQGKLSGAFQRVLAEAMK